MSQAAIDVFMGTLVDAVALVNPELQVRERISQGIYLLKADHLRVKELITDRLQWAPDTLGYPERSGGWDLVEGGYLSVQYTPCIDGRYRWKQVDLT